MQHEDNQLLLLLTMQPLRLALNLWLHPHCGCFTTALSAAVAAAAAAIAAADSPSPHPTPAPDPLRSQLVLRSLRVLFLLLPPTPAATVAVKVSSIDNSICLSTRAEAKSIISNTIRQPQQLLHSAVNSQHRRITRASLSAPAACVF